MSYYLCYQNHGNLKPIAGPMRSMDVVQIILSKGDLQAQAPYCNASRYELSKLGLYPRNQQGNNQITFCMAALRIEKVANLYDPKGGLFYPIYIDKQGHDIEEVQDDEMTAFCYDCTDWGTAHFRAERKAGKHDHVENLGGIELRRESAPESTDFVYCGHCHEIIETGVLHTFSQEIDHWLSVELKDFKRQLDFPKDAWIMHELLTSRDAQTTHPNELLQLANRIIDIKGGDQL